MLIQKSNKIAVGDIMTFKMAGGDEIVCRIVEDNTDSYVVSKPSMVVMTERGPAMILSMLSVDPDSNVTLYKHHIALSAPTAEENQRHYIQATSGIIT
jgi:hypothetical protein